MSSTMLRKVLHMKAIEQIVYWDMVSFAPIKAYCRLNCHFTIASPSLSLFVQHYELTFSSEEACPRVDRRTSPEPPERR